MGIDAELLQAILAAMHAAVCSAGGLEDTADTNAVAEECRRVLVTLARECPRAFGFAASFAGVPERKRAEEVLKALELACGGGAKDSLLPVRAALIGADD